QLMSTPAPTPTKGPTGAPPVSRGVGDSAMRPDGARRVTGQFACVSDLWADDMIWGGTLRSPHPYARISSIQIGAALATAGVYAVLTHEDVPGTNEHGPEQP